jgi:hypothetical protein
MKLEGSAFDPLINSTLPVTSLRASPDVLGSAKIGDWSAMITGRLGYAWGATLIYVKGGAAFVRVETSVLDQCATTAAGCGNWLISTSDSKTVTTGTLGGARPNDLKIVYFRCGCLSSSYGWWTTGAAARRTSHLVLKQSGDLLNWRPRSKGSRTPIAELGEAAACVACRDIGSLRMCFRGVHHGAVSDAAYSICRSSFLACRTSSRTRARSAIASPVRRP